MRTLHRHSRLELLVALMLVLALLPLAARVSAQDATSHPAHIHQGTCENLGDVVEPLDNIGTPEAASVSGASSAIPVQVSETEVDLSLDDILAGEHAINIHESEDNIQTYIACGDIGGAVRGGTLVIGLAQLNTSSYSGIAILEANDAGGTTVSVFLTQGAAGEPTADDDADAADDDADDDADDAADDADDDADDAADDADDAAADDNATEEATAPAATTEATTAATAAATEEAAAPAGETIEVAIVNFAFDPPQVEINVGDTVVWTNQDGVPHTATGQNRDLLQSGTLQPGDTYSQTFTTAGEIPYFCEFHPNMNGMVIVSD